MNTTSWQYPNIFDVARNRTSVMEDRQSVTNRVRLLMLTEPTELYMNPQYGVGLKKYMFQYNNDNVIALIKDKLIEQLRLWEPCVEAEKTTVERGLLYTGGEELQVNNQDSLELTVTVYTVFGDTLTININPEEM